MSAEIRTTGSRVWPAALRWTAAGLVVAAVHGVAGWTIATWERAEAAAGAPPAAVMIELAPIAVAPETTPQEVAPGPEMVESEPEPPPPEPVVEPKLDEPPPEEPEPVAVPEPEIKIPELPPLPDAAAMLTPPPPPPPPKPRPPELKPEPPPKPRVVERRKPVNRDRPRAERTTAPAAQERQAETAAAPQAGASAAATAARQASWRGSLMAHLNRYKRFPSGATPGTVQVAFRIDRAGRVLSASLVRGSGDAELDREAIAMINRASPVPAPPEGMGGSVLALAVPVRFSR